MTQRALDVMDFLQAHDAGREPERLALKYRAMQRDPFTFLRATDALFHARLPRDHTALSSPSTWICGDLHLENFGSFKGAVTEQTRLAYFDLNDFDEAACAPISWEMLRFLTSLRVAGEHMAWGEPFIAEASAACWQSYCQALAFGSARWLERETASGAVRRLLKSISKRNRGTYIQARLDPKAKAKAPRILVDGKHALPATDTEKQTVQKAIHAWAKQRPSHPQHPNFFNVLDVARRIAGTGSLGLMCYTVLVQGRASTAQQHGGLFLLDVKTQPGSCLQPYLPLTVQRQMAHAFADEAQRVAKVQHWAQAAAPAFLSTVEIDQQPCLIKELLPTQDRLNLALLEAQPKKLFEVLQAMPRLAAWAHLRTAGRAGADGIDTLIAYGETQLAASPAAQRKLLQLAKTMAQQNQRDWLTYCRAAKSLALKQAT